jgi:stearoyl-CoA desaturase (delta-9 desaturase)
MHKIMKDNVLIRILQAYFAFVTVYGIFNYAIGWTVLAVVVYGVLETFGGNIGLHRYFGHRSFKTSPRWEATLRFLSHYIGVGSVIGWVGQHRSHHKHSDTENDVHCFRHLGLTHVLFGIWRVKVDRSMIRAELKDPALMWYHRNYWRLHGSIILFWLLVDWLFGTHLLFAAYAMPALMCLISGYVLAIVSHSHGYQSYQIDRSTNSWIANLYTLGEGWHNNHHANPRRLRQGEKSNEWDLPAWVIENFIQKV